MKLILSESFKNRVVGFVMLSLIAILGLFMIMRQTKEPFEKPVIFSVRLPDKPIAPKVIVPKEEALVMAISTIEPLPKWVSQVEPIKMPVKMPIKQPVTYAKTNYSVQIGVFKIKNNAQKLVKQLQQKGYAANMVEIKLKNKVFYKVMVGKKPQKASAQWLQKQLADNISINGFVVKSGVS